MLVIITIRNNHVREKLNLIYFVLSQIIKRLFSFASHFWIKLSESSCRCGRPVDQVMYCCTNLYKFIFVLDQVIPIL